MRHYRGAARLDTSVAGVVHLSGNASGPGWQDHSGVRFEATSGHGLPPPSTGASRRASAALETASPASTASPRVLPGVKARRYAPAASRLSALTPGPRALRTGNCPTMPHFRSRTLPSGDQAIALGIREMGGRGNGAALRPRPEPTPPLRSTTPPHRRVRREHEIAGGDQVHGRSSGKTSSGPANTRRAGRATTRNRAATRRRTVRSEHNKAGS